MIDPLLPIPHGLLLLQVHGWGAETKCGLTFSTQRPCSPWQPELTPTPCISCSLLGLQSLPLDYGSDLTLRRRASSSKKIVIPASTQVSMGRLGASSSCGDALLTQGLGLGKDVCSGHMGQSCSFQALLLCGDAHEFAFDWCGFMLTKSGVSTILWCEVGSTKVAAILGDLRTSVLPSPVLLSD